MREAVVEARNDTPDFADFDIRFLDDGTKGFFSTQMRPVRGVGRGSCLEVRYVSEFRKPHSVAYAGRVIWRNTTQLDEP